MSAIRLLSAPTIDVVRSLALLESAVAVTDNRVVALRQGGVYAPPSRCGGPLRIAPGEIALRLDPEQVSGITLAVDLRAPAGGAVLRFLGHDQLPVHQTWVRPGMDRLVVDSLDLYDESGVPAAAAAGLLGSTPSAAPMVPWEGGDQLAQLDAVLVDCGRSRFAELRRQGRADPVHRMQPVEVELLPEVLGYLCSTGLPVGIGVFTGGVLQACTGSLHGTAQSRGRLLAGFPGAAVEIDLARVSDCLLVRSHGVHGLTSAFELYDHSGRCAATLTQFGLVDPGVFDAWEDLAGSLRTLG